MECLILLFAQGGATRSEVARQTALTSGAATAMLSSCRIALQSLWVTMALGLVAAIRRWETFDTSRWFTWVFVGTMVFILTATPIFYWSIERRLKQSAA